MKFTSLIYLSMPLLAVGCTQLNVQKLSGDRGKDSAAQGIRYSLPKTFLSLAPAQDGVIKVEEVYLPDTSNSYAISATNVLSDYTLDISIEKGLLTKIAWGADTSGLASQAIGVGATLGKSKLDADVKAKADQAQKTATAQQALDEAELNLKLAEEKLRRAKLGTDTAAIAAAEAAVADAKIRRDAAKEKLDNLRGSNTLGVTTPAANKVDPKRPAIYVLQETETSVKLVQVPVGSVPPTAP